MTTSDAPIRRAVRCPPPPDPFVGRARELSILEAHVPTSRVMGIVGIGGIGKTALALALAARLPERFDLLPVLVSCEPGWGEGALLGAIHAELSLHGEESLGMFLRDPLQRLEDKIVHLAGLLDRAGLALLADDAGAVEAEDLKTFLGILTDRLTKGRAIVTSRLPLRVRSPGGLTPFEIKLKGLNRRDATRLVAALSDEVDATEAAERAEGHPLYLRLLARGGPVGRVPLLSGILEGLGEKERRALEALSVLRVPLSRPDLQVVLGPGPAEVLDRLADRFLVERAAHDRWRLAGFVADAVRDGLEPVRARAVHQRAAALFESRYLTDGGPLPEVVLEGFHHMQVSGAPDRAAVLFASAVADLEAAGCAKEIVLMAGSLRPEELEHPTDLGLSVARSLRQIGRATDALTALRSLEGRVRAPSGLCRVWIEMAQVHQDLSDASSAQALYFKALDELRRAGDRAMEAAILNKLATVLKDQSQYDRALSMYRQAADLATQVGADGEVAFAMHNMGKIQYLRGQLPQARGMADRARKAFEKEGDALGRALAINLIANIHRDLGDATTARRLYTENLELYRRVGSRFGEAFCLSNLADIQREEGQIEEALAAYEQARDLAVAIGNRFGEGIYTTRLAEAQQQLGRYPRGLELARAAQAIWSSIQNDSGLAWALSVQGEIERDRGRYPHALEALEKAQALRERLEEDAGVAQCLLARAMIMADAGQLAAAESLATRAEEHLRRRGGPQAPPLVATQAYLRLRRGERAEAARMLEDQFLAPRAGWTARDKARALGVMAQVALEEGRPDRARTLVEEALDLAADRADRRGQAIALIQLARVCSRSGDAVGAREAAQRSLELAEGLGDLRGQAQAALALGELALDAGRAAEARRHLEQASGLANRGGFLRPGIQARLGLAMVAYQDGDLPAALALAHESYKLAHRHENRVEEALACGLLSLGGEAHPAGRDLAWALAELRRLDRDDVGLRLSRLRPPRPQGR